MNQDVHFGQLAIGLGLFLFGMSIFEESLKNISGRGFKRFLRENTKSSVKAILSGTLVTAVLQSSSLVSLMTLALVGAGVIPFRNAIALVWGANLGTTATGWIFTLLGFKLDLQLFSSICLLMGALGSLIFKERKRVYQFSLLFFGFGALFLGLDFMKDSIKDIAQVFDLEELAKLHYYWFYPIGIALTALIQSSSATMVITLSALTAGIVTLEQAMAIVIGENLGTTITIFIGAFGGDASKKRVAWGHFLFNLFNNVIYLSLLPFLGPLFSGKAPLYSLVSFHTLMNFTGILCLTPFLGPFSQLLLKINPKTKYQVARFIHKVSPVVPDLSVEALKNEGISLVYCLVGFMHQAFIDRDLDEETRNRITFHSYDFSKPLLKNYNTLKRWEGECLRYYLACLEGLEEYKGFNAYDLKFEGIKKVLSSAKHIKDIHQNLEEFFSSGRNEVYSFFSELRDGQLAYLDRVMDFMEDEGIKPEELEQLNKMNHELQNQLVHKAYMLSKDNTWKTVEGTTSLLVLREIYSANKGLMLALEDIYLHEANTSLSSSAVSV